jgi:hypothetical protein
MTMKKYIIFDNNTKKVKDIFDKEPKFVNKLPSTMVAEYEGEIPQADYLLVAKVQEKTDTWTEPKTIEKEVKKIVPKVVKKAEPIYNENDEVIDYKIYEETIEEESTEIVEETIEEEKSRTYLTCDLVANFMSEEIKAKQVKQARISELKRLLTETDYKAIKYAEGLINEEDYAPIKAQRQAYRDEINRLETSL